MDPQCHKLGLMCFLIGLLNATKVPNGSGFSTLCEEKSSSSGPLRPEFFHSYYDVTEPGLLLEVGHTGASIPGE